MWRSQAPAVAAALADQLGQDATIAAALDEPIEAASALTPWFLAAGVAIGCVETAVHAAVASLARNELPRSAFGLLVAPQSLGNLAVGAIAGLCTAVSPRVAFPYLVAWMGPDAGWAAAG